ncbi:unnamed protein product [Cochlearia groenlandica]
MTLNSVSSQDFSFPSLASQDSSLYSGEESPPLWHHSPENLHRENHIRSLTIGKDNDHNDKTKSFSYVERRRSLWSEDKTEEETMDMLWEDLNEEIPQRSQSLRIEINGGGDGGGDKKGSVFSDQSSVVAVGFGMKLTKKTETKKNVLVLIRALKKLLVSRRLSQRSPAKTHPR